MAKRLKQQADESERQLKALLAIRTTIGTEIGTRSLGVNIPGQKPNDLFDPLYLVKIFGGMDKQGGDIWKKQQELEMTEGLLINASGEDRLKLLERRKQLQQEINDLNKTDTELQQEALMILGNSLNQIQSAMDMFGISQTSLIGQMVSGFQRILEIVETIKAVQQGIHALSLLGIFHSGGVPVPMAHTGMMLGSNYQGHREAIVKMHSGEEIITPYDPRHRRNGGRSIGTNVNVNYNVRAIDARSFETTINTSQHRRSLVKAIDKALRSNN
jgi:ribosomal protein S6E (S10)